MSPGAPSREDRRAGPVLLLDADVDDAAQVRLRQPAEQVDLREDLERRLALRCRALRLRLLVLGHRTDRVPHAPENAKRPGESRTFVRLRATWSESADLDDEEERDDERVDDERLDEREAENHRAVRSGRRRPGCGRCRRARRPPRGPDRCRRRARRGRCRGRRRGRSGRVVARPLGLTAPARRRRPATNDGHGRDADDDEEGRRTGRCGVIGRLLVGVGFAWVGKLAGFDLLTSGSSMGSVLFVLDRHADVDHRQRAEHERLDHADEQAEQHERQRHEERHEREERA